MVGGGIHQKHAKRQRAAAILCLRPDSTPGTLAPRNNSLAGQAHAGGTEGATSGAATDQLAAPAPGKKRKRVDFNLAAKVRSLVEVVLG